MAYFAEKAISINMPASLSKQRIIFCGPMTGILTGQRVALMAAIEAVSNQEVVQINTGGSGLHPLSSSLIALKAFIKLLFELGWKRGCKVYVTPSRTVLGAIRELPLVLLVYISKSYVIAHWHGAEFKYLNRDPNSLLAYLLRLLWQRANVHIALCETMRLDLLKFGFQKAQIIPNFCDLPNRTFDKPTTRKGPLKLLFFSNLIPEKGVFDAICAHKELFRAGYAIELHIVGARIGSLPNEVEQGLTYPGVIYHGALYGSEKIKVLESCDVLLFPSVYRSEAFPITLLEGMSVGLAVIAYRHNYIEDFFEPSGGYLVPYDLKAMIEAIIRLFHDSEHLHKLKIKNQIAALKYSKAKYQSRIRKLFESCES